MVRKIAHAASARRFSRDKNQVVQNARIQKRGCEDLFFAGRNLSVPFICIFSGSLRETFGAISGEIIFLACGNGMAATRSKRKRKVR